MKKAVEIGAVVIFALGCKGETPLGIEAKSYRIFGYEITIANQSDEYLEECVGKFEAPDGRVSEPVSFALSLEPHEKSGPIPGGRLVKNWTIESGQKLVLSCKGYGNKIYTIP